MTYADCFVAPVPTAKRAVYEDFSRKAGAIYREHGALDLMEFWGDDVPPGEVTSYPLAVKCGADETVAVSVIVWPSKAARDAGNAKIMQDPRMHALDMPFDGKRALVGGFQSLFSA